MNENDVPGDMSGLSQRLDALNGILGGIRTVIMENEQQVDQLRKKGDLLHRDMEGLRYVVQTGDVSGDPSTEGLSTRLTEMNELLGQLKNDLSHQGSEEESRYLETLEKVEEIERGQGALGARCDGLEGVEIPQLEIPAELWERLGATETSLHSMGTFGDGIKECRERLAQLETEGESLRGEISGVTEKVGSSFSDDRESRQALEEAVARMEEETQQLESRLVAEVKGLDGRMDQSFARLSGAEEMLRTAFDRLDSNKQDLEGLFQGRDEAKSALDGVDRSISMIRADLESANQNVESLGMKGVYHEEQTRQVQENVQELKAEAEAMKASLDGVIESLKEQSEKVSSLQCEMGEATEIREELQTQVSGNRSDFESSLEGLQAQVSGDRSDFGSSVEALQTQVSGDRSKVESSVEGLNFELSGIREEIQRVREQQGELESSFQQRTDQKVEGVSKALTIAKDHLEGERHKMTEDLESLKKGQRELGDLKGAVEDREKDSRQTHQEIHRLKDHIEGLRGDLGRQKMIGVAIAACAVVGFAFILTLGNGTQEIDEMVAPPVTVVPEVQENWIPLEEETAAVGEALEGDTFASLEQAFEDEAVEMASEPADVEPTAQFVTTAFAPSEVEEEASDDSKIVDYVVQDGESLWTIARKHKTPQPLMERIEKIKEDNSLDSQTIRPGQVLRIFL